MDGKPSHLYKGSAGPALSSMPTTTPPPSLGLPHALPVSISQPMNLYSVFLFFLKKARVTILISLLFTFWLCRLACRTLFAQRGSNPCPLNHGTTREVSLFISLLQLSTCLPFTCSVGLRICWSLSLVLPSSSASLALYPSFPFSGSSFLSVSGSLASVQCLQHKQHLGKPSSWAREGLGATREGVKNKDTWKKKYRKKSLQHGKGCVSVLMRYSGRTDSQQNCEVTEKENNILPFLQIISVEL